MKRREGEEQFCFCSDSGEIGWGGVWSASTASVLPSFVRLAGPCVASVCCGGKGAVNQQLARYRSTIEAAEREAHPTPYLPPSLSPTALPHPYSPVKPFINQSVGSQATPDTWHTILADRPDIVGGGQV